MKKIITFIIVITMCFAMTACSSQTAKETNNVETAKSQSVPQDSENITTENSFDAKLQDVELVGPWHIDQKKTDIRAIEADWETFPGYGEWGASMEIRSNGQISWFIGAAGGTGTYTVDGDLLHAELTDSIEQKEVAMDFVIVGKDEIKMTYADTEITWEYGDKVDELTNDE